MATPEESLQKIERAVFSNELPAAPALAEPDYDSLLDARDAAAFATAWDQAYHAVSAAYQQAGLPAALTGRIDGIREHVYKRVYRATGVPELASYVSDDFDLLLRHLLTHTANGWVNALWLAYQRGSIPSGVLPAVPGTLAELLG